MPPMHGHSSIQILLAGHTWEAFNWVQEGLNCSVQGKYRLQQEQGANQTEYSLPEQAMYICKAFVAPLLCILSTHQHRKIMFTAAPAARCRIAFGFFQIIKNWTERKAREPWKGETNSSIFIRLRRSPWRIHLSLCHTNVLLLFPSAERVVMKPWLRHQQRAWESSQPLPEG